MSFMTIDAANDIYECSITARIHRHITYHKGFYNFCKTIRIFDRTLATASNDEYWAIFMRWLKRYRFYMLAAPLPFNWQDPQLPDLSHRIIHHIEHCNTLYPQFALQAQELLDLFLQLASSPLNPLLERLTGILARLEGSTALLVKESRLVPFTETAIQPIQSNVTVLAPSQMDYSMCYQNLIVIGAISWFPKHIFTAPRANTIHLISYRWLANTYHAEPAFIEGSQTHSDLDTTKPEIITDETEELFEPEELLPIIDARTLSKRFEPDNSDDDIPAKLLSLAGGMGVFVEADDQTSLLVIDLDDDESEEESNPMQRISLRNLRPGMFILLRTRGSGDYIVPVANKIMGTELTHRVRYRQAHWKKLLKQAVVQRGLFETCIDLLDLGSQRANELNVRNWISSRTIRPNDPDDFRAILRLIGLEADFDKYWEDAEIIVRAHRKAGFDIRRQLLQQIRKSDMGQLRKKGQMEFVLPEADGGSLTAFRIEYIDTHIIQIPFSHLGELFPLE